MSQSHLSHRQVSDVCTAQVHECEFTVGPTSDTKYVNLKIKSQGDRQMSIYLGSENYNLGSTDSGRNPNSVPTCGIQTRVFMEKRKGAIA